ncbi:MAG: TATA-box-binding protein [Candidatus Bathyarchaeia archaeon]
MFARLNYVGGDAPMGDVQIQNVVAVANLHQNINLHSIKKALMNAEYRPKLFPGLVLRLKRPKTATLIFRTGKMVCTGAKSPKMARRALRKVVRELKKVGIIILGEPDITIQNVVASAKLGARVDLERAARIMDNVMYEPEQFPGLVHRMVEPKVVLLVFHSGKIVITGAKSGKEAQDATDKLRTSLRDNHLLI